MPAVPGPAAAVPVTRADRCPISAPPAPTAAAIAALSGTPVPGDEVDVGAGEVGAGAGGIVAWPVGAVVATAVAVGVGVGVGVGTGVGADVAADVATVGSGGSAAVEGAASPGPANNETSNNALLARLPKSLPWGSWMRFIFCSGTMVRFASAAYISAVLGAAWGHRTMRMADLWRPP